MEQLLQSILEEVKGVKSEVQQVKTDLRGEMQDMKKELREELLSEMDVRFAKQSKEIAQELQQILIQQQRRDNKFEERLIKLEEEKKEILLDIRKMQTEVKGHEYRISKLEVGI